MSLSTSVYTGQHIVELKTAYHLTYKQLADHISEEIGERVSEWTLSKRVSRWYHNQRNQPQKLAETSVKIVEQIEEYLTDEESEEFEAEYEPTEADIMAFQQLGHTVVSKSQPVASLPSIIHPPEPEPNPSKSPEEVYKILTHAIQNLNSIMEEQDPTIVYHERDFQTDQPVAILWASCFHLGGRWTSVEIIERTLKSMLSLDNVWIVLLGDNVDGFAPWFRDVRSIIEQPISVKLQKALFMAYFEQIKHKILAGFSGQHDGWWFEKRSGENPLKQMFLDNSIPFFDGQGYLTFKVGNQRYQAAAAHMFPGKSAYNRFHPHVRALRERFPSVDMLVMGDKHQSGFAEEQVSSFEADAGARSPFVHYIQTGTAKVKLDPYTLRGWSRGQGEYYWTVLHPEYHEVRTTRHLDEVIRLLDTPDWNGWLQNIL